jgi:hypothetical protein
VVIKKVSVERGRLLSEIERVQLKKSSSDTLVKKWVEFWRWQSKVTEEMVRKELDCAKKTSCVILSGSETLNNLLSGCE